VDHPLKRTDKIRQTKLAKYGVDHHMKVPEIMDKKKATCLSLYGAREFLFLISIPCLTISGQAPAELAHRPIPAFEKNRAICPQLNEQRGGISVMIIDTHFFL
jgi:hypothetical protein